MAEGLQIESIEGSLIQQGHALIAEVVEAGDWAVDATIGNGYDSLFLARCVGGKGRVIGFDIQQAALDSTRQRLRDAEVADVSFELHLQSHDQMARYVTKPLATVMFNLGYLPGADKSLITLSHSTLSALAAALSCLRSGGILSVMCYPGHEGGDVEAGLVKDWLDKNAGSFGSIRLLKRNNASDRSPFLLIGVKA